MNTVAMSDLCPVAVTEVLNAVEDQPQTLQDASCLALKEKKYCDVIFTFSNLPDRIEAHEVLLKLRSPVFEKIFRMRRSGNVDGREIEINESTPERFQEFLEFIYMDKFEVNAAGALDLLHLAHSYKVQPLMKKCEELLKAEIQIEDCVQVFETARRYGRHELVDRAGEIMVKSLADLIENGALANAEEETLVYLLKRDDLTVQEVELFEFILKWGKDQGSPSDGDLSQDKLKNIIPLIRYTNMTPYEFKSMVLPTDLLSAEEIISIFSYFAEDGVMRKGMKIIFNIAPRNPQFKAFVDFYFGNDDASPRSASITQCSLKLCTSFQAQLLKKVWPDYDLKKPAITAIKVKWPSRNVANSRLTDTALNFFVCIMECSGIVNDQSVKRSFKKNLVDCKDGDEDEVPVEPPVELMSGSTYCVIVEDEATHHQARRHPPFKVNYTFSGAFSPYDLRPEAKVDLGGVYLKLKEIQKDSRLSGFENSTETFPIKMIRGIKISLV